MGYGIPKPLNYRYTLPSVGTGDVDTGAITEPKLAADDEVASTFVIGPVLHDFGFAATAIATKLTDAAPCKLEVLSVRMMVTEAKAGGSADDTTTLAKDAANATPMTAVHTMDMSDGVFQNKIGSSSGMQGLATADSRVAEGADIYIYSGAQTGRTAGIYAVEALCKKIA
jgi:hypothetical protein